MEKFRSEDNRPDMSDLLLALRSRSDEDIETKEKLTAWMEDQKQAIEAIQDPKERAIAQINNERKMARLHYSAGYSDAAWQELQDARNLALQENLEDLAEEIIKEMEEFGKD